MPELWKRKFVTSLRVFVREEKSDYPTIPWVASPSLADEITVSAVMNAKHVIMQSGADLVSGLFGNNSEAARP